MNDSVIREIGGGNWFILSLVLGLCFVVYFIRELWEKGTGDQRWLAVGLAMICFGSGIRAFLVWMLNIYNLHGWESIYWSKTWPWFAFSVVLNSLGCLIGIWILLPLRWRPCTFGVALFASLAIPVALFYLL